MRYIIHTDGGARGNPGPAAIGVVIEFTGQENVELSKTIGETTNNVAEYTAVIVALEWLVTNGKRIPVEMYLDSQLVVNQLNDLYKVKDKKLRQLLESVRLLEKKFASSVSYRNIPREKNKQADFLVNQALDAGSSYF